MALVVWTVSEVDPTGTPGSPVQEVIVWNARSSRGKKCLQSNNVLLSSISVETRSSTNGKRILTHSLSCELEITFHRRFQIDQIDLFYCQGGGDASS
jgi:hypothetical protein